MGKFKKSLLFYFATFLSLFIIAEIVLSIVKFYHFPQELPYGKWVDGDQEKIRILVLGESTTATDCNVTYQGLCISWPNILSYHLLAKGFDNRVYNVAISSMNTTDMVNNISEQIEFYQPHIVLSMIGINDSDYVITQKKKLGSSLKIFNFIQWGFYVLKDKFISKKYKVENIHSLKSKEWVMKLKTFKYNEKEILAYLKNEESNLSSKLDIGQLYAATGFYYYGFYTDGIKPHGLIIKLLTKAKSFGYNFKKLNSILLNNIFLSGDKEKAVNFLVKYIENKPQLNYLDRIIITDLLDINNEQYSQKIHTAFKKAYGRKINSNKNITKENYQTIFRELNQKNIPLIAIQYPLQNMDELKSYFNLEERAKILFVENILNFQNALEKYEYYDVFYDKFAGDFGHKTLLGHKVLVHDLFPKVEKKLKDLGLHPTKKPFEIPKEELIEL